MGRTRAWRWGGAVAGVVVLAASALVTAPADEPEPVAVLGADLRVEQLEAAAAGEATAAFSAAGLVADPPGAVPLTIVTETAGQRKVTVVQVGTLDEAATTVAGAMRGANVVSVGVDQRAGVTEASWAGAQEQLDAYDQWQLDADQSSFAAAWATSTGAGVTVAVLDSGVQGEHEDLAPRVLPGIEMLAGGGTITALDGWNDQHGHGTHVAGIIAATQGNGLGVSGMAPSVSILPVRVLDATAVGWMSDITAGVYWAVEQGATVLNLSLGSTANYAPLADAIDYAVAHDVVVVAAAGNAGPETIRYPAAYPNAIAVAAGAWNGHGAVDSYSSYSAASPFVDITAPGSFIVSTLSTRRPDNPTEKYGLKSGTSMAAPHVAAAAALVRGMDPALTATQVRALLESTATDVGVPGPDPVSGAGLVDPAAALAAVAPVPAPITAPDPAPVVPAGASRFMAMTPQRVLDTRSGAAVPVGGTVRVPLAGSRGIAANATAVALNVTVTESAGAGYVQVLPTGRALVGESSNLNVAGAGETIANQVTVPLGVDGSVSVYVQGGGHVLVDVFGWYNPSGATSAGRFVALAPVRLLDTRSGAGVLDAAATGGAGGRSIPQGTTTFQVAGLGGVPAAGASAVILNVTATDASPGYVQVMPTHGAALGAYSNLNISSRDTVANLVIVPIGDGGRVSIHTQAAAHVVADVMGYVTSSSAPVTTEGLFVPVHPGRVTDSRATGRLVAGSGLTVRLTGTGAVPASGVAAVLANVTAVDAAAPGYVQVFPTGEVPPGSSSNLNVTAPGQTVPNAVAATLARGGGSAGTATVYAQTSTHILFDVFGWFTA